MRKKSTATSFEDLLTVSRWARVAVLARAVRRLQPIFAEAWPEAPKWCAAAIDKAIAEGEAAAVQGSKTAEMNAAALGAMKVYGAMPDKIMFTDRGFARQIGYVASRVSFAGGETEPWFAVDGITDAIDIAERFAKFRKQPDLATPFVTLLLREYEQLKAASQAGKWKVKTPVDPGQLGPIWPDGVPAGWPEPPTSKSRPKAAKPVDWKALQLPAEVSAFLQAGEKLKYRAAKTEVGPIQLKPLDHLRLSTFEVEKLARPKSKTARKTTIKTPSAAKSKLARVQGVDLVAECDSYGPEGILVWLPDYQCFGQHDPDHAQMLIFPKTKWADIVASPAQFLDAQWNDFAGFGEYLDVAKRPKAKRSNR